MTGFELLIEPAAKGLASLITDTTKTGGGSALGKVISAAKAGSSQAIFQASHKYIQNYQKRHCQLKVLGMREPVELSAVYTGVKLLDERAVLQFDPRAIEDSFREDRLRGHSVERQEDKKYSGIAVANERQYLMVLGGPGAGKSTFLRKVGLEALRTFYYERAEYQHRLIPVLLELKRFESKDIDIAKSITAEFETCGFPEAEKFTQNALAQGNLLVLLDGLDEVPSANLNNVLRTIQDFVDRYDDNRFMASCRVAAEGYRTEAFRRFSNVKMSDFDDEQIQQFVINWFGSEQDRERGTANKCWEVLQKPENKASKELAHTPLLLTYLCLVYDTSQRFPDNRSSLYKKALRILLEEWAAEKRILRDDIYEGLSIEQEEILLAEIAYDGMCADQLFFSERELSDQIRTFLAGNLNAPKHLDSKAVLNAIEVQQGIFVERAEDTYSFSHLTLQEYLTAQYIVDNNEWETLIKHHLTDRHWREVFLSLPGLMTSRSGADSFLLAMKQQADDYLYSPKLKQLVQWAEVSTHDSSGKSKHPAKRSVAVFFASALGIHLDLARNRDLIDLALALALALDIALASALARALASALDLIDLDLALASALAQALALDIALALTLASDVSQMEVFRSVDFSKLIRDIKKLEGTKPEQDVEISQQTQFLENLHHLWFSALGIEAEVAMLSKEEAKSLADYLYACELMIRCKEGAVRVSPDVWAGIESRILTVPAASEAAQ